jgi:hypothetical protein
MVHRAPMPMSGQLSLRGRGTCRESSGVAVRLTRRMPGEPRLDRARSGRGVP